MPQTIIFTDVEADDFIGLAYLFGAVRRDGKSLRDLIIVVSLGCVAIKVELVRWLWRQFSADGDEYTNVFAGTGGLKDVFAREGSGILTRSDLLDARMRPAPFGTPDSVLSSFQHIDNILLLTNPIDLVPFLCDSRFQPTRGSVMGGLFNGRPTFNWTVSCDSTRAFMAALQQRPELVFDLYSSQFFATCYNGYFNTTKFPEVIRAVLRDDHVLGRACISMVENWDDYVTSGGADSSMVERIGADHVGNQFAPADVVTCVAFNDPTACAVVFEDQFIAWNESRELTHFRAAVGIDVDAVNNLLIDMFQ